MLGEAIPLKLTGWAWLQTGIDRRIIGWDADACAWVASPPVATVGSSAPGTPPRWAMTVSHRAVQLSEPARVLSDDMLGAIDQFRAEHHFVASQSNAAISVRLWRPQPTGRSGPVSRRSA
ncbi:hypothetical protein [Azospirillum canadense]|uniref:hypothetical protein n=1 Tax=Azospirillum canadense TaxID=403962 RepID=UPI0022275506|nr:hypothetical protein [Azospirillum canadense]MCW2241597.1 hypothetical protein [Azospirillum canadense]